MNKRCAIKSSDLFVCTLVMLSLITAWAHAGDIVAKPLRWANDKGRTNRIDWQLVDYVFVYANANMYVGWTGTIKAGDRIRVQATNMKKRKRVKVKFDRDVEWENRYFDTMKLTPGETRVWEFQAIHDPFNTGVTVRGRTIF